MRKLLSFWTLMLALIAVLLSTSCGPSTAETPVASEEPSMTIEPESKQVVTVWIHPSNEISFTLPSGADPRRGLVVDCPPTDSPNAGMECTYTSK